MRKTVLLATLVILMVVLGTGGLVWATPGSIKIFPDRHEITFATLGNNGLYLEGIGYAGFIRKEYVKSVVYNSGRAGWEKNSTCRAPFALTVTIPGTPNNDRRGNWAIEMETGEYYYFVLDPNALAPGAPYWEIEVQITGAPAKPKYLVDKVTPQWTSYLLEYGNYKESLIRFFLNRAEIQFGCNFPWGLDVTVNPADVEEALWNSNAVGWKENSTARGKLFTDSDGNYVAVIDGTPRMDEGNFCFKLKDGTYTGWTLVTFWKFERAKVTTDPVKGYMNYRFRPDLTGPLFPLQ